LPGNNQVHHGASDIVSEARRDRGNQADPRSDTANWDSNEVIKADRKLGFSSCDVTIPMKFWKLCSTNKKYFSLFIKISQHVLSFYIF